MSREYDLYLKQHKTNVTKGFRWIQENLPNLVSNDILEQFRAENINLEHQICFAHDASKTEPDEYEAYDRYFYGGNRSYQVVQEFNYAWINHIHRNPHHWQHWVLIHDDPDEAETIMDMPYNYILEMICDWWAFSWNNGDLNEIFGWYDKHKDYMKLSDNTRMIVDDILGQIKGKVNENGKIV